MKAEKDCGMGHPRNREFAHEVGHPFLRLLAFSLLLVLEYH